MSARLLAKELGPRIWNVIRALKGAREHRAPEDRCGPDEWRVTFEGRYSTWQEAAAAAGADAFPVGSKDHRASLSTTVDDWDGYLKPHEIGLLAAAMSAMISTPSPQKTVVDFGGGYGVHFLTLLKVNLVQCRWEVVELKEIAELGAQKWRHNEHIRFIETLGSATQGPDLLIASGVLQYFADPYAQLRRIEALYPSFLFIDRLPLTNGDRDVYTVQRTGAGFFGVEQAFPCCLLSRNKLIAELMRCFDIVFRFEGFQDPANEDFNYEAVLLRRRASN